MNIFDTLFPNNFLRVWDYKYMGEPFVEVLYYPDDDMYFLNFVSSNPIWKSHAERDIASNTYASFHKWYEKSAHSELEDELHEIKLDELYDNFALTSAKTLRELDRKFYLIAKLLNF